MGEINDKMTALANKIREKNYFVTGKLSVDDMIEKVDELIYPLFSGATAIDTDVSAGQTFFGLSGTLQTGSMPDTEISIDGNIVKASAGRLRENQHIPIPSGEVSVDKNVVTVKKGYVYDDSIKIKSGSTVLNSNKIRIYEGYQDAQVLTIPAGSVTLSPDNSTVIVTEGYVMDDEITLPGGSSLFRCAAVYGPKKVSGFIVSGAGTAAVNGNYIPIELRTEEDTPIYKHETAEYYYFEMWGEKGICTSPQQYPSEGLYYNMYDEGWYPGNGGTEPAPEVTASDIILNGNAPKRWDGYKIEKSSDGAFSVASALTTGLPYAHITPVVGNVYTQDGLVKADYIRMFRSGELLIIPLVSNEWKADTGQTLTIKGGDRVRPDCGCTQFLHNTSENYVSAPLSVGSSPRTFTVWLKSDGRACSIFSIWSGDTSLDFGQASDGSMRAMPNGSFDYMQSIDGTFVDQGVWRHYAIVLSSGKFKAYLNGEYVGETDLPSSSVGMEYTSCRVPATKNPLANNTHYVRDFRVYSRELSAAEILAIFNENNPVK